ncbi:extracellular solute-binding protein [Streptomyces sp. NPDC090106]|uniref:sugar ABC transporter substrate-binding protein n=1 Tax=Streptomyces sp. NPDC090106 TaxID=3365946 RepID=UPI0037F98597
MRNTHRGLRTLSGLAATGLALTLAGCGGSDSGGTAGSASGTYTFWDPYPQFDAASPWADVVTQCGKQAGVKVERTAMDTSDVANKALLAAQQGQSPDLIVLDNPVVSTLAEGGVLADTATTGLDTTGMQDNLVAAGTVKDKDYGVPVGANTLALYYNADVVKKAGVDPADITDWDTLTAALSKVEKSGKKGITFSGIKTEEGTFQFLPWFWGAGGDLNKLDSPQAVDALTLWKTWLDAGYAPNSVINNTQTTSWQEFASGDFAFAENGTWQLANAEKTGFDVGVVTIPGKNGGNAPAPTGGELLTVPVQKDAARYTVSAKIADCLTANDNLLKTDTTLSYVAPVTAVQTRQVAQDEALKPWVEAVAAARGRTSDGLGTDYPVISEQLWTAVQAALSGAQSPKDALDMAQEAAAAKTGN